MPIDADALAGARLPERSTSWSPADLVLYHLALGAGARPTAPGELAYTLEDRLKALPSFAALPGLFALFGVLGVEGVDVELGDLLHGEQEVVLHAPLAVTGSVTTSATVGRVWDKGGAATVDVEAVSRDAETGTPLFTNRLVAVLRGAGGFGGERGPRAPGAPAPARPPDLLVTVPTLPQQALLYRLTGDRNPLHADPAFAAAAGFERPILHGLCSFGIACKAIVDGLLAGDVARVARYRARFAGVLFPGETVEVSAWRDGDRIVGSARCAERDAPVLSGVLVETRP